MSEENYAGQWGITSHNIRKGVFDWKIANFDKMKHKFCRLISSTDKDGNVLSVDDVIESPTFSVNSNDLKWSLVMFSIRPHPCGESYVCFEFRSKDTRYFTVDVNLSISILIDNKVVETDKSNFCVKRCEDPDSACRGFMLRFLSILRLFLTARKANLSSNNELHLLCEYELISDDAPAHNRVLTIENHDFIKTTILRNFEKQWKDKKFCDFELVAPCDRKLSAHKFVLSAGSPVFFAMLENDMKEKKNNFVEIKDLSYESIYQMLYFMYSGKIEKLDHKNVDGILAAAEKYQIDNLKYLCKEFLFKNLNVENALKTLQLSKMFGLTDLIPHVDLFVKKNCLY